MSHDLTAVLRPADPPIPANARVVRVSSTLSDRIHRRLRVPCTPSEIAASFDISKALARAYCYQLKRYGKAFRTDKRVPLVNARGRQWEFLWSAA